MKETKEHYRLNGRKIYRVRDNKLIAERGYTVETLVVVDNKVYEGKS